MKYQAETDYYEAFIFQLDDVLYPEKDYLLQVYYLFAQFIEYTEQLDGQEIIRFMKETYEKEGEVNLFLKTAARFSLPGKYAYNFDLLHQNARLPLKLLLFAPVLTMIQEIITAGRQLFLLADGDPEKQLNKIRQIEWNGAEQHLTVYFTEEIAKGAVAGAVGTIAGKHNLDNDKIVFIGRDYQTEKELVSNKINFLPVAKLLVP
jgi:hypothetical protein